jgi:hypothetical protein
MSWCWTYWSHEQISATMFLEKRDLLIISKEELTSGGSSRGGSVDLTS